jgi:glycosyltransferase involved in cell wall biosynthesis
MDPLPPQSASPVILIVSATVTPAVVGAYRQLAAAATGARIRLVLTIAPSPESGSAHGLLAGLEDQDVIVADHHRAAEGLHQHDFGPQWLAGSNVLRMLDQPNLAGVIVCGTEHLGHVRIVRACRRKGIPCVVSTDESTRREQPSRFATTLNRYALEAAGCIAVFGELGRVCLQRRGIPADRIVVAPLNPVLSDFAGRNKADIAAAADRLGLPTGRRRMVVCSHLVETKRIDMIVDGFADIAAMRPEWDLVVIGDGPLRQWLTHRVPSDIRHRVRFTGYLADRRTVGALVAGADVAVVTSEHDPWSVALVEAAAAGTVLVSSDAAGAAHELLIDGENGRSFPRRQRPDLADALLDATDVGLLDSRKARTREIFAHWIAEHDTTAGLALALRTAGARLDGLLRQDVLASADRAASASRTASSVPAKPLPETDRPTFAIIGGGLIPYRVHFHRRIMAEFTSVRLTTLNSLPRWWYPRNTMNLSGMDICETDPRPDGPTAGPMGSVFHQWSVGGNIIRYLQSREVAAVLCNGYNHWGHIRVMLWCKLWGIPCLLYSDSNAHGDRAAGAKRIVKHFALRAIRPFFGATTVCGRLGIEYFLRYGYHRENIFISPYEPDYDQIRNLPDSARTTVAAKFDLRPDRRRLVFCGRLVPDKRPDLALAAFLAIAEKRPELDLVMIGDGTLRAKLERMVPDSLRQRVRFTGFLADPEQIGAIYTLSDVFVLPSDYEPWAVVVNEAAAAGCVLVASSVVGAARELIDDGVNGRLVPPGDQQALIDALLDATDPARIDERKRATGQVLHRWRTNHDPVDGLRKALAHCGVTA